MIKEVKKPGPPKGKTNNPNGRPKGSVNAFSIENLHKAMRNVEKKKKIKIFQHFVEMALIDNKVLVALMKKVLPDMVFKDIKEPFPFLDEEIEIPVKSDIDRFKIYLN